MQQKSREHEEGSQKPSWSAFNFLRKKEGGHREARMQELLRKPYRFGRQHRSKGIERESPSSSATSVGGKVDNAANTRCRADEG